MNAYVYVDGFNLYYAIRDSGNKWLNLKALAEQVIPSATITKVRYFTARVSGASDPQAPARQQVYFNALGTLPEVEIHLGSFLAKAQWRPLLLLPAANRVITDSNNASLILPSEVLHVAADPAISVNQQESLPVGSYRSGGRQRTPPPLPDAIKGRVFAMEEKGSDVNLAVHLVNDAWAGRFDAAVVISNDTDLVEPIRIVAQELNKPVYLLTPPGKFGAATALTQVATHQRHIRTSHLAVAQFPAVVIDSSGSTITKPASW